MTNPHKTECDLLTNEGYDCTCGRLVLNTNPLSGLHAIPFMQVIIPPGQTLDMIARPQVPVVGPYYLGISTEDDNLVYVERLQFANITPISGRGGKEAIPHVFFERQLGQEWPDGLIPIDGPFLYHANTVYLAVRNPWPTTVTVNACVWAKQEMNPKYPPPFEKGDFTGEFEG